MKKTIQQLTRMLAVCMLLGSFNALAQDDSETSVFEMSLEELLNMEVTSVSKKAERLQDVASSIYVFSGDDLMKSGATTLHEVLRNVPGYWGVQDQYNNVYSSVRVSPASSNTQPGTVLFLLDGTPIQDLMSSTFSFDNFDIPLDEIDRIEVIRGSGGTVYGANSATGVVNIFTKNPDKYDGINARVEGATPGYLNTTLRAGGQLSDNISLSGYAKYRMFTGWESLAGKDANGEQIVDTRFTDDYERLDHVSAGLKAIVATGENSKISLNTHYNLANRIEYTNAYGPDFIFTNQDILYNNDFTSNRFVGNLRYDVSFNEDHSLFVRASTNLENDFHNMGGGYHVSNSIIDFELQDNVSLGAFNDLSFGANYRLVGIDIHDINNTESVNYIDPVENYNLKGAFVQDKLKLADGKFNVIAGVKAENYSLINDKFYLSPMLKASYIANEDLTFWAGFTQSYTTPGYNTSNVDLYLFQAPNVEAWTPIITGSVYQGFYDQAYQSALDLGFDDAMAQAFAADTASGFVSSPTGQALIAAGVNDQVEAFPSFAVKNGANTVPTKFQTVEAGFRAGIGGNFSLESNIYYSIITDGIGVSPDMGDNELSESPTQPGRYAVYYLYGNYVEGNTVGMENMLRWRPTSSLFFELSHSWLKSTWKLQENDDFDINDPEISDDERDQTPDVPSIPVNVFRLRAQYDLASNFNVNLGLIYGSEFNTQAEYVYAQERYRNLALNEASETIALNDSRVIVNLRLEKMLMGDKLSVYLFGNDLFNSGSIADANPVGKLTIHQIGAMYGLGANFRF